MTSVRAYMPLLPSGTEPLMYVALALAVAGLLVGVHWQLRRYGVSPQSLWQALLAACRARPGQVTHNLWADVVRQEKVRETSPGGAIHTLIFAGFLTLFAGTFLIFVEHDLLRFFGITFLHGPFYLAYEAILDTAGLALLAGVAWAFYRRLRPGSGRLRSRPADLLLLTTLAYLGLSGFLLEGIRLAVQPVPWGSYAFAGQGLARWLIDLGARPAALAGFYPWLWWSHVLLTFVSLALLALGKFRHPVAIPLNRLLAGPQPSPKLSTPFQLMHLLETGGDLPERLGLSTVRDLDWRRRLNLDTCVNCARCDSVCPAVAAGRALSPRSLVHAFQAALDRGPAQQDADLFATGRITATAVWSCTNCSACVEICPAGVDHVGPIVDLRRHLVAAGQIDEKQAGLLEKLERNGNPYGLPSYSRADWLREHNVPTVHDRPDFEYLYWVGCAAAYDARLQSIALAVTCILDHAGVAYAVLGSEERCSGEAARRLGEEGRFQMLAAENIALLQGYGVRKILTHCPHGYNTLKHDYPDFGGDFTVVHHTELIHQLLQEGRLPAQPPAVGPAPGSGGTPDGGVTFHDPCNLGRLNGIYEQPRELIRWATGQQPREMAGSRNRGLCCGAGGANAWYGVPEERKISHLRLEQARQTGAGVVGVACPYCATMLDDAARGTGLAEAVRILDVAELVAERLTASAPVAQGSDQGK